MENIIELKNGKTYFHVAFYDKDLSIPSIETYIYVGIDEEDKTRVLFKNAEGYVADKEGIKDVETYYISYEKGKINTILDKKHLIEWLRDKHSPRKVASTYEYRYLGALTV